MKVTEKAVQVSDLRLAFPITKIDEEKRMVYATMTTEDLDSQGDIVDYDSACKALESWPGNVREQHDNKKAVGSALEIMKDGTARKIDVGIYVSKGAPDTWEKVLDKTLKGTSIGVPVGKFRREATTAKVAKANGETEEVKCNRLFVDTFSELSLVDNPANPAAQIYLVKSQDGGLVATDQLGQAEEKAEEPVIEKATESTFADPDNKFPLDTPELAKAAASYFARPRNRKKYSADQQKSIDGKIEAAKKGFKIGEYSEKMAEVGLFKCCGSIASSPADWVPLNAYSGGPDYVYLPRTFGDVWEDTENVDVFPLMGQQLGRTIANIMAMSGLSGQQQSELIQRSFDEFIEEIQDEINEADEEMAENAAIEGQEKFTKPQLTKAGARNSKTDLDTIQGMHDAAVKLGAACKQEEKAVDVDGIMKALAPLNAFSGAQLIVMTQEQVEKLAAGTPLDKVMEAITTKALEVKTELEAKNAETGAEIAKVAEITSKHAGELSGLEKRLGVVEKSPATVTLPVSRPPLGMQSNAAVDAQETNAIALADLNKQYDGMADGVLKTQLGMQIAQLQIKVAQHKAAMR